MKRCFTLTMLLVSVFYYASSMDWWVEVSASVLGGAFKMTDEDRRLLKKYYTKNDENGWTAFERDVQRIVESFLKALPQQPQPGATIIVTVDEVMLSNADFSQEHGFKPAETAQPFYDFCCKKACVAIDPMIVACELLKEEGYSILFFSNRPDNVSGLRQATLENMQALGINVTDDTLFLIPDGQQVSFAEWMQSKRAELRAQGRTIVAVISASNEAFSNVYAEDASCIQLRITNSLPVLHRQ